MATIESRIQPVRNNLAKILFEEPPLLDEALNVARGKDVYVDGGATVRAAMDAGRVDELVITVAPVLLGQGKPLFAGLARRHPLDIISHRDYGRGMVQLVARPA